IYPPELAARVQTLVVPVDTVNYNQVHRFLNITEDEFNTAVSNGDPNDPVKIFRSVLAKTWRDHRVALNLYSDARQHGPDPMLTMVSYEGTDAVDHLFAPFHPPYREDINQTSYRKYWPAIANYYAQPDRLIGQWSV